MSSLTKRVITAIVLVLVLIGVLFFAPAPATTIFMGLFLLIGSWEWSGFFLAERPLIRLIYVGLLALGAAAMYLWQLGSAQADWLLVLAVCWWLLVAAWLVWGAVDVSAGFCGLAGLFAFLPGWYALMRIFAHPNGPWLFIWLVAIVAAADIGAYFTGKAFGKTKLAPQISPGKTREGLVGGMLCSTFVAMVGAALASASALVFLGAGLALALISVVGDLTVSLFKRRAGLKDTGRILPGHGGVMDRIDSLIAALPLFALALAFAGILTVPAHG